MTDVFDGDMEVKTLEPIEIFASKTNALLSRAAARDLYDFNNMLYFGLFDESEYDLFRKCIVFYDPYLLKKSTKPLILPLLIDLLST